METLTFSIEPFYVGVVLGVVFGWVSLFGVAALVKGRSTDKADAK